MAVPIHAATERSGEVKTQDGERIHYVRRGSGTPLILLHGNAQSSQYFVPQMSLPFDNIAIDSRNHGQSSSSKAIDFRLMARDVLDVMNALKIEKSDFLGFSDGANLAMVFAKYYPERVNHLILNSGNMTLSDLHFFPRLISKLQNIFFHTPVSELLVKEIGVTKSDLAKFQMPVLVIVGQYDLVKQSASRKIAKYSHGKLVEIPRAFHKVSQTRPKLFNQIVTQFLQNP
jgi:pimeloyl-ACP methyl ester carboxylesterase